MEQTKTNKKVTKREIPLTKMTQREFYLEVAKSEEVSVEARAHAMYYVQMYEYDKEPTQSYYENRVRSVLERNGKEGSSFSNVTYAAGYGAIARAQCGQILMQMILLGEVEEADERYRLV